MPNLCKQSNTLPKVYSSCIYLPHACKAQVQRTMCNLNTPQKNKNISNISSSSYSGILSMNPGLWRPPQIQAALFLECTAQSDLVGRNRTV